MNSTRRTSLIRHAETAQKRKAQRLRPSGKEKTAPRLGKPTPADLERWPALELPFVKFRRDPRPAGLVLDYWAPPTIEGEDGLDAEFRGGWYARLAIKHMNKHPEAHPILSDIIGCMVKRGRFWAKYDSAFGKIVEDADDVAVGFVVAVANILCWADAAGIVERQSAGFASHLERCIAERTAPRCVHKSAANAIAQLRAFARGYAHV